MSKVKRRYLILLAAVVIYAVALTVTWCLSTRRAARQTESMLDYAIMDLRDTLNGSLDTMLMHIGDSLAKELGSAKPVSLERMKAIAEQRELDEINIVSRECVILASTDENLVGKDMLEKTESAKFKVLVDGGRHAYSQPFRAGAHNSYAFRKYVGVAFPGGNGFVQVGMDESRVTHMFPSIMRFIFDEWLLGENGFFLCADVGSGVLISNPSRHRDEALSLEETGYDPSVPGVKEDGSTTFKQRLFGEPCDCRAIIFAGHRIIAALPPAEFYTTRTLYVSVMALVLALILAIFVLLLWRIDVDSARLKTFYAAEEEKRTAELELGRTIQMSALPTDFPNSDYFRISASMAPAREVGGDFYDCFPLDDTHYAFLVADVSGKGITGALYMMTAKTLIKDMLLATPEKNPAEALSLANNELCRSNRAEMFLTAWVGVLDIDTGMVTFANAGHNPPLLQRVTGGTEWVKERSGCPLACFDNVNYKSREIQLSPGDMLFLYTDGVTEAVNNSGELFGNDRLFNAVRSSAISQSGGQATQEPGLCCTAVRDSVSSFAAGALQADDLTMLALQFLALQKHFFRTFPCNDSSIKSGTAFVEECLDGIPECPGKARSQLLVALDEVLSNVIRCSGASGIAIELRVAITPPGLSMSISDDGKPFDPLRIPPPDTSLPPFDRPAGGLGILLLRSVMDGVSYRYAHGCNILTLKKFFNEGHPGEGYIGDPTDIRGSVPDGAVSKDGLQRA